MKKLLYSLLTLAAALTVASCQKEQPVDPYGDGPAVNASFAVSLGDAMTKAFADGTTVNTVYAALYEVGGTTEAPTYTYVATADPAEIKELKATVQINGKLKKGKSYRVAFWAQYVPAATEGATAAPAASAYAVAWDPAPVVTVTPTGDANDETRDAFAGTFNTGEVTGNITPDKDIPLTRPFSQVNVLVPVGNMSATTATSSMTVKQAPTKLNLNTGETGTPADYVFAEAAMADLTAFGDYAQTHKYVAMNYILVDQAAENHYHDVEFKVTAGDDTTGDTPKSLKNIPLKANVRTNIVGNIFESFGFNGVININPDATGTEVTDIRIAVGDAGTSADKQLEISPNGTFVGFAISRDVTDETPDISYNPAGLFTASWDAEHKGINILPNTENGSAVITVTFPEITKATTYSEGKVDVYVKVGTGQNTKKDVTIDITLDKTEITVGEEVEISARATVEGEDVVLTPLSWSSSDAAVTVTPGDETTTATLKGVSAGSATITVTYAGDATYNEATASVDVTVSEASGGDEPTVTTIADIKNAFADGALTNFAATFSNVIVTYVNGKNAYVEDETGGLLFYYDGVDLVAGQTLSGSATLTGTVYKNLKEITAMTKGEDYAATAGATIPVTTVTLAELNSNYDTYESRRVKVAGVTNETAAKAKASVNITQGTTSFVMRIQNELSTEVPANSNFDVIGYPAIFNSDKQLNVWTYDDFTINSAGDHQTTISGMSNQSLTPGESYTFAATTDNPNGTIVYSIVSGNDVVDLDGAKVTVKSTATVGATAVIKASVAATTGYLAAEATATITVKSADSTTQEYVVEFTYSNNGGLSTTAGEQTGTLNDISVHLGRGALNANNSDIRIYKDEVMTISTSSGAIKKIVITSAAADNGPGKFGDGAPSGFAVSTDGLTGTWTGSATSVGFTATDAQVRMTKIAVTYEK